MIRYAMAALLLAVTAHAQRFDMHVSADGMHVEVINGEPHLVVVSIRGGMGFQSVPMHGYTPVQLHGVRSHYLATDPCLVGSDIMLYEQGPGFVHPLGSVLTLGWNTGSAPNLPLYPGGGSSYHIGACVDCPQGGHHVGPCGTVGIFGASPMMAMVFRVTLG